MTSVGVVILSAKRCGDHFANCSFAFAVQGAPPKSQSVNHSSSVTVVMDSRLKTPSCVTAALKRPVLTAPPPPRAPPVPAPRDPLARRVHERHLHDGVEDGVQVDHDLATPVAGDLVHELLAEARRPARVWRHDDPALCGPQALTPAERPAVLPRALRAAVDEEDDGIF